MPKLMRCHKSCCGFEVSSRTCSKLRTRPAPFVLAVVACSFAKPALERKSSIAPCRYAALHTMRSCTSCLTCKTDSGPASERLHQTVDIASKPRHPVSLSPESLSILGRSSPHASRMSRSQADSCSHGIPGSRLPSPTLEVSYDRRAVPGAQEALSSKRPPNLF